MKSALPVFLLLAAAALHAETRATVKVGLADGSQLSGTPLFENLEMDFSKIVATNRCLPQNPAELPRDAEPPITLMIHDPNSDNTRPVAVSDFKIWNTAKLPVVN